MYRQDDLEIGTDADMHDHVHAFSLCPWRRFRILKGTGQQWALWARPFQHLNIILQQWEPLEEGLLRVGTQKSISIWKNSWCLKVKTSPKWWTHIKEHSVNYLEYQIWKNLSHETEDLNPNISTITLNINGLKHKLKNIVRLNLKQLIIYYLQETYFKYNDTDKLKMRRQ